MHRRLLGERTEAFRRSGRYAQQPVGAARINPPVERMTMHRRHNVARAQNRHASASRRERRQPMVFPAMRVHHINALAPDKLLQIVNIFSIRKREATPKPAYDMTQAVRADVLFEFRSLAARDPNLVPEPLERMVEQNAVAYFADPAPAAIRDQYLQRFIQGGAFGDGNLLRGTRAESGIGVAGLGLARKFLPRRASQSSLSANGESRIKNSPDVAHPLEHLLTPFAPLLKVTRRRGFVLRKDRIG